MIKSLNIFMREKKLFISIDMQKPPMLGIYGLQHQTDKAGSATSFSSKDTFPKVSLPAEKLKLFIE